MFRLVNVDFLIANQDKKMKIKDLLKKLFPDKVNEIEQLEEETPAVKASGDKTPDGKDDDGKKYYEMIKAENEKLLNELAGFKQREEERENLLRQKASDEAKTKIEDTIKKAIEEKRIAAKDEKTIEGFKKILEKDFENGIMALNVLPKIAEDKEATPPSEPPKPAKTDKPILATILERNQITNN